ncbi:class F sortase [Actinospongicola halichondriae]|uniref:class F sortase n=1 Tax=Actinospongicola halichondriae TaxID=3236844 RepID=UPI003D42BE41
MRSRRHALLVASAAVLLAVGACSAPAGEGAELPTPDQGDVPSEGLGSSALSGRTERLDSALYDPSEHRAPRRPTGLSISALGVEGAPVLPVGLEPNGEMEIPGVDDVGWYELGVAPGEVGSAVLAAHIAYDGVDGVFRHLERLSDGDDVSVAFDDGSSRRYRITAVTEYGKDELPAELFSRTLPERLVLITCGGEFNASIRSYESNVVAFAEPVDPADAG